MDKSIGFLVCVSLASIIMFMFELIRSHRIRMNEKVFDQAERELGVPCGLCSYEAWGYREFGVKPHPRCSRCGKYRS